MSLLPLVVIVGLLVVMMVYSNRAKQKRIAQDAHRRESMTVGTEVMTTAGLYGTVVSIDPDNDGSPADTVLLSIAPNVEVTWALAAVKERPTRAAAVAVADTGGDVVDPTGLTDRVNGRIAKPKGRTDS